MTGTTFGDFHSAIDLHLIQQSVSVGPARPKTNFVEIPGADGYLDLTEALGGVKYGSRTIKWTFALWPGDDWDERQMAVSDALNGLRCRITLDSDPEWYFVGRLTVSEYKYTDRALRQITVEATCQPWRLRWGPTSVSTDLTTPERHIVISNANMPTTLTVAVTADTVLAWDGQQIALSAGNEVTLSRLLPAGDTMLTARTINLLTLDGASGVHYGITYTVDSSAGTVTATGTATSTSYRRIVSEFTLPAGTYLLSGCPEGGSTSSAYWLRLCVDVDGTEKNFADTGAGREVVLDAERTCRLFIAVRSGCEMDDVVFTPVLRSADGTITFTYQEGRL